MIRLVGGVGEFLLADLRLNALDELDHSLVGLMTGHDAVIHFLVGDDVLTGIPVTLLQWAAIILWAAKGWWWLFVLWAVIAIPWGIVISKYYYDHTAYLCPQCHKVFTPTFKEMFFAKHTPATRKLTCTSCGHHGFCVEVAKEEEGKKE